MAKKKDKPQVINNIGELNLEIDYDKLAVAIVKANSKHDAEANQSKKFTSGMFSMSVFVILRVIALLGWIIAFCLLLGSVNILTAMSWEDFSSVAKNIFQIVYTEAIVALLVLYPLMLWKSAKEIETEKDRNYIISVFSGIVSFAALIVALVALFKEVG